MELKDFLNSINFDKKHIMQDKVAEKAYVPYVINRCISYFPDTILHANRVNMTPHMSKKMQYEFLLHSIRPRKRYSKWIKPETSDRIDMLKDYFGYSTQKAIEVLPILTDSDFKNLENLLDKGG